MGFLDLFKPKLPVTGVARSFADMILGLPAHDLEDLLSVFAKSSLPTPSPQQTFRAFTILIGIYYDLVDRAFAELLTAARHKTLFQQCTSMADAALEELVPQGVGDMVAFKPYIGDSADTLLLVLEQDVAKMPLRSQLGFALQLAVHDHRGIFELYSFAKGPSVAGFLPFEAGQAVVEALGYGNNSVAGFEVALRISVAFKVIRTFARRDLPRIRWAPHQ